MIRNRYTLDPSDRLEIVMSHVKQMELTLLCMNQVRQYLGTRADTEILDALVRDGEMQIAALARKVVN